MIERMRPVASPPVARLLPRETLIALLFSSPLLVVFLSKNFLYGSWSLRIHTIVGLVFYAAVLTLALAVMFDGVLAQMPTRLRGHHVRLVLYWLAAMIVVVLVTRACAPVFAWAGLSFDPVRRTLQGAVLITVYLGTARLWKRMGERIADERSAAISARAAEQDARLSALQARTNPHFLFNTLNSIMSLIGSDPGRAEQVLGRLAMLMRYTLERAEQHDVGLHDEIAAIRNYLDIERVRFGKRLRARIDVDDGTDLALRVPPMVLQPLVENAVLHGVATRVDGGTVRVSIAMLGTDRLELVVEDEGPSPGVTPHVGTRTSLANLEERLRIIYGGDAKLVAQQQPEGGFCARVVLPVERRR